MTLVAHQRHRGNTEEVGLIGMIVGGRRELFGDLITPHLAPLLRSVRATIGGHPDVQDIVQQSVLKAFIHLEQFRCEASFRTWLIGIGMNEARQWRRKAASSRITAVDASALAQLRIADDRNSPLIEYQRAEIEGRIKTALAALPEKYRIVFLLCHLEGLSLAEAAVHLQLTLPAVKTRHLRARKMLARSLGRQESDLSRRFHG